jgi:nicotinamidase-related amidase
VKTALVIVDVQKSLLDEGPWNIEGVLANIARLIEGARQAEAPIVFIRDRRVEPDSSLHPRLATHPGDIQIEKSFSDSFIDTDLDEQLRSLGIRRVIIVGLQTDYCVDTTCRRAASLRYAVVLASDAHTTFDHDALAASQIVAHHNHILRNLKAGVGSVTTMPTQQIDIA